MMMVDPAAAATLNAKEFILAIQAYLAHAHAVLTDPRHARSSGEVRTLNAGMVRINRAVEAMTPAELEQPEPGKPPVNKAVTLDPGADEANAAAAKAAEKAEARKSAKAAAITWAKAKAKAKAKA